MNQALLTSLMEPVDAKDVRFWTWFAFVVVEVVHPIRESLFDGFWGMSHWEEAPMLNPFLEHGPTCEVLITSGALAL